MRNDQLEDRSAPVLTTVLIAVMFVLLTRSVSEAQDQEPTSPNDRFQANALSPQSSNGNAPTAQAKNPPEEGEAANIAKQLSNPIANLVTIPFQFNWQGHIAPFDSTRFLLNVQPVVPFTLNHDWNLIMRFIFPFLGQPAVTPDGIPQSGTSDITLSLFLSPSQSKLIWGAGPAFGIPTTSNPALTSGKWSAGPTAVVLWQEGPWTVLTLWNQLWSYASVANYFTMPVNQMFLQPGVAYQMPHAVTLTLDSEATFNWEAASGQKATVPVIVYLTKITTLGPFPFAVQGGGGYYVKKPDGAQHWLARLNFVLILPREKK